VVTPLKRASYLATGEPVKYEQTRTRLLLEDLPEESPDEIAGVCVFKLEFDEPPRQVLGPGYELL
jgi:hypothetical protein